jgi:hypothetical protein
MMPADRVGDRQALERLAQVHDVLAVRDLQRTEHPLRDGAEEPLVEIHEVPKVAVRLVVLHHRELGVVTR